KQSFTSSLRRHEISRTLFLHQDLDEPLQVVLEERTGTVEYIDISAKTEEQRTAYLEELRQKDKDQGFDLTRDLLIRIFLVKVGEEAYDLLWSWHHIIMDGWSLEIIFREFMEIYRSLRHEEESQLPPPPPYSSYILWLEKQDKAEGLAYWEHYLENCDSRALLPRQTVTGDEKPYELGEYVYTLDENLGTSLNALCRERQVTINTLFQSAWGLLLQRYNDTPDVVFGSVVSGRSSEVDGIEDMIGLFINTLPVRVRIDADTTFDRLMKDVQQSAVQSRSYEYIPLPEIQAASILKGDLIDHIMIFDNYPFEEIKDTGSREGLGFTVRDMDMFVQTNYDFNIVVDPAREISIKFSHNALCYDDDFLGRVARHLTTLLRQVSKNPTIAADRMEILEEDETRRLLEDFNRTGHPLDESKTIHTLFNEQVERTPDNPAVVFGKESMSYRQLNRRANRLARVLRDRGVTAGSITALMLEPSTTMMEAVIAVLKAGGAYLPINPGTPQPRVIDILEDSRAGLLLTSADTMEKYSFTTLKNALVPEDRLIYTGVRPQISPLDSIPMPNRSLVDYQRYSAFIGQAMVKNALSMQATRGCPYNCLYCHKIWPKTHVFRTAESLVAEIKHYYKMGVRRFVLVDDIFNFDRPNSTRFFQSLIKEKLDVHLFFPNGMRGDILTKDYIDLMVEAGTVNVALALETASPRLQRLLKKNLNLDKLYDNLQYFAHKHPRVIVELFTMHGFPTETEEEALKTLEFIKSLKWIHFPYVFILKIYPNTEMAQLALTHGISLDAINKSESLAFHELPATLPFEKNFTLKYQARFMDEYFLSKERLLHLLPHQMTVLTEDEALQKYDSYLPFPIKKIEDLLQLSGIRRDQVPGDFIKEADAAVPHLDKKISESFSPPAPAGDALKILLLDLSQFFSHDSQMLYDVVDPPLGLMYLLTYLQHHLGEKIDGKIAKSRIDFPGYDELKELLLQFKPDIIGIRSLTFYKDFLHKTAALIRQWGIDVPIIAGGPYATSSYTNLLQDPNIDLAVLGEGEETFKELVTAIIKNNRKMPESAVLSEIKGIAYATAGTEKRRRSDVLMLDLMDTPVLEENLDDVNAPSDPAYVIYTSGSTGKPKGTVIENRNLHNLVTGLHERIYRQYAAFEPLRVAMVSPYIFDASIKQIFAALLKGHALYPIPSESRLEPMGLYRFYKENRIDISDGTPTHLRLIMESHSEETLDLEVRNFLIGGEILPRKTAARFLARFKDKAPLITNVYGPTECTVDSTSYEVTKGNVEGLDTVPIGRPMPNVEVYILDSRSRLLPAGLPGELCISGKSVARGYLNRPEQTAAKFIPHPFGTEPLSDGEGVRLYRSGDLARVLPDGNIEVLGRIDHQVKIRGFRIELGEIENQLLTISGIREAIVTARETENDKYLCAYLVAEKEFDTAELKNILLERLPDYMIPAHFMQLTKLPLTPNGKVNFRALPEPGAAGGRNGYVPPRNTLEEKLTAIWSDVLGVPGEEFGIDADFFELGGHSLKATITAARIHKELQVTLPIAEIFNASTIRELARYIATASGDTFISIPTAAKADYYPLTSAQKRLFLLYQLDEESTGYNMPQVVELEGEVEIPTVTTLFRGLIRRHESLRTSFHTVEGEQVQKVHETVDFDISTEQNEGRDIDTLVDAFVKPFKLETAPLFRVGIITMAVHRYLVIVDMHHIIADGISAQVLVREFMTLYAGRELPPVHIHYKDYACWLTGDEEKLRQEEQEKFWLDAFSGTIPQLNLPTDFPRPAKQDLTGSMVELVVDAGKTRTLQVLAAREEVTLYMMLLAIFTILPAKLSLQEDIVVGTPVAGRRHADLQNIVGMFVNTLPLRNYPSAGKTFRQFLKEVKERTLDAFRNQEYQLEELMEKVVTRRDPSRNPLFDVFFSFQNIDLEELSIPGLSIKPYSFEDKQAKFDLTLQGFEKDGKLYFTFVYAVKLFQPETAGMFAQYLDKIISLVLENPDIKLADIQIISQAEKNELLSDVYDDLLDE
ncbi:MAG: AMP-binding protein, partial [bacterium]|nr:AMP-binding protein [bacterium]